MVSAPAAAAGGATSAPPKKPALTALGINIESAAPSLPEPEEIGLQQIDASLAKGR